jgi:phosphoglycolate phosphatase-like HAD superfamily hydrolase
LPLELAELLKADEDSAEVLNDIFQHLEKKKSESDELRSLVGDGLKMINAHLQ